MSSPDTHAFNSLITSIEEPIESLESTKDVIDKYLADSFDSFIKKLNITLKGKDSPLFVEVEDDTEVSQNSDESKRKKFHSVLISDYLVDLTKKMRGVIVHNLMNLVDDRLVRNQKAFLHVKNKCLERLHASRDSSVLYRNVLEASMTTKYSESVRIMKDQYKETIVKENTTLSKDLSDMQSTYRTLWTLHDQLTLQLTKSNNSVDILHEKIRSSYEDTYALRESNALLQDRHENYLENILKEVKKRVKKLKRKKRLNPSNLEELDLESSSFTKIRFQDNADSDIDDESDTDDDAKNIALEIKLKNELLLQPCQTCLTHQTEITELKIRLDAAFSQLNRKKSNRTDINAEKNFGIINSQLSTGTPIKFQKSEYLMDPGPAFHKYSRGNSDEDMSFYNSLHSQILDNVRQGINVEDVGGKSKGKVRAGSISNLLYYIDDNNESVEYDDEDDDDDVIQKKEMNKNNFQHSRSKSQENSILESSALAVQDPLKDFLKTLTPRKSFSVR